MTEDRTGTFINGRGQTLHTVEFVPDGKPEALLIFHHGYGEHTGRYDDGVDEVSITGSRHAVFQRIAKGGIALHSYDCHGHGRSEPLEKRSRALIWHFHEVVDDLLAFSKHVRLRYQPGLPVFVGGQSMGGLTALHAVLRDQSVWDGVVLGTATIDVEWTWFLKVQAALGNLLAAVVPRARIVPAVRGEDMSGDQATIESIETDPYNVLGNVRARTANELLHAFGYIASHESELELPIYAHHGTKDRLANLGAVKRLLKNAASRDVTLYEVPGGYHELFMGPEKDDITDHILSWVLEHAKLKANHDEQQ